jgi:hypothetical protein
VERLIGTIRRECLDRTLFWTTADLEMKLPISNAITMVTARIPGWPDGRQTRAPSRAVHARLSRRIAGRCTVEGCITLRSPHDRWADK